MIVVLVTTGLVCMVYVAIAVWIVDRHDNK